MRPIMAVDRTRYLISLSFATIHLCALITADIGIEVSDILAYLDTIGFPLLMDTLFVVGGVRESSQFTIYNSHMLCILQKPCS
jgi:hypothetical protein